MKRIAIIVAAVVALAAIVLVSVRAGRRDKGTKVYAEEARRRDISAVVKASGQVDPRVKVNISAHVVGKIDKLHVEEGDAIAAGQPFLELEKEAFVAARDGAAAQLAIQRSRLRQAEVDLANAEVKLRRMRRLATERIAAAEQLDQAELEHNSARLAVEQAREAVSQARASYDQARDALGKTTIYAPLSGRVIALNAKQGEVVVSGTMNNPGSVIATIADLSEILVEVDVDETEIVQVETGQKARVDVDAVSDREYHGSVVEIGSSGFSRPQQPDVTFFKVKVLLDDPDAALRPGMSARAEIDTAFRPGVLVVPIQAVVDRAPAKPEGDDQQRSAGAEAAATAAAPAGEGEEEITVVFVVEDGKARQRPVETGISDETSVEVTAGLAGGEQIVTGPYRALKRLKHGDRVRITKESEEAKTEREQGLAANGREDDDD